MATLPEPTWQNEKYHVMLYNADCEEILSRMPKGSIHAVITDPPFGIGFKYESHVDSAEGYGEWLWPIIERAEGLCKPGSPIFVWQGMPNCRRFAEWFPRKWRIFAACKNFVQMRPAAMQYAYDPVVVWWTDGDVWARGTASRDFHIGNTSPSSRRPGALDNVTGHPCPRPLGQVAHIVSQWVRPGSTVMDPFMGSGTTGVACVRLGRHFIGVEIEKSYFEIAAERITKAIDDNEHSLNLWGYQRQKESPATGPAEAVGD